MNHATSTTMNQMIITWNSQGIFSQNSVFISAIMKFRFFNHPVKYEVAKNAVRVTSHMTFDIQLILLFQVNEGKRKSYCEYHKQKRTEQCEPSKPTKYVCPIESRVP